MNEAEAIEYYRKYRPQKLSEVVGQKAALSSLSGMGKAQQIPHFLLFTGPSGCGKTTVCRILRQKLKCHDRDFDEVNMAKETGIDGIRSIERRMMLKPMAGPCRIWMLDECHAMSKNAMSCILKMTEDTPSHVYFFMATTHPEKLLPTIRTRATEIKFDLISKADLKKLVGRVVDLEGLKVSEEVQEKVAEYAEGSGRKALVILQQAAACRSEEDQLAAVAKADGRSEAIDLARALIDRKGNWSKIAALLKKFDDDAEGARRLILGYASSVLLRGGPQSAKAFIVIDSFRDNLFDSGKAGLVAAAYEVFHSEN